VARILITGVSGTGKSTALGELGRQGFAVTDLDAPDWSRWVRLDDDPLGEWVWREDRVADLLTPPSDPTLFVAGCASNQGQFYPRFDAVVLLSASEGVMLRRIAARTTNDYGKQPAERDRILSDRAWVEPLLRETATHEVDGNGPVAEVVAALVAIERDCRA